MSDSLTSFNTIATSDFIDDIGANTHIPATDGEYGTLSLLLSDLQYLGLDQIRDVISDGANGSTSIASFISAAQDGIQFTFRVQGDSNADLQAQLTLIDQVEQAVPGSVIGIEGPNEINNFPVSYDNQTGLQAAIDMQFDLYSDVKNDPNLANVSVDYFTGYDAGNIALGPDPAEVSGLADADNQHAYPTKLEAPAAYVNRDAALPNTTSQSIPAVYTETGYSTNYVSQYVQAVYTLDLLMDTAQQGISKTYLYQLMDAYAPGSSQGDDGYGLFDYTTAPKEAATAIHNLTSILDDNSSGQGSQNGLNYSVTGLPDTGNSMLLQRADGSDVIAVWAEPELYTGGTEVSAPSENVTISLPGNFSSIQVFDPMSGTNAIENADGQNSVTVSVSDHPILIDVSQEALAADAPCFAAGTYILTTQGEVAVEDLSIGDVVITNTGEDVAVRWIGKRTIDLRKHPDPQQMQPICIAPHSFGEDAPNRNLVLSPDHALYVAGHLIPAKALINHSNITQLQRQSVTYYHIELPEHAVIFAANMAVETYLDTGNRCMFENGGNVRALHPGDGQAMREDKSCAPFTEAGIVVETVRKDVMNRFYNSAEAIEHRRRYGSYR